KPWARASSRWRRIIRRRMPRRRWVGSTATTVRPEVSTAAPPGTVMSKVNAPVDPTMASPSQAPMRYRSSGTAPKRSSRSGLMGTPKTVVIGARKSARRSGGMGRMSMSISESALEVGGGVGVLEEEVLEVLLPLHQGLAEEVRDERRRRGGEARQVLDEHHGDVRPRAEERGGAAVEGEAGHGEEDPPLGGPDDLDLLLGLGGGPLGAEH